jgi:hypothetical protein
VAAEGSVGSGPVAKRQWPKINGGFNVAVRSGGQRGKWQDGNVTVVVAVGRGAVWK